jgi:hypothetical protein
MATVKELTTKTTEPASKSRIESTATIVSDTAASVATAASDAAAYLPDLADRSRAAFIEANRRIQAGSDATLSLGTAVSFGFAVGMLIGGASRIIVALAFIPVAMMGLTMLDRSTRTNPKGPGARVASPPSAL